MLPKPIPSHGHGLNDIHSDNVHTSDPWPRPWSGSLLARC